ncbi:hypothetical protein BFV94_4620 [Alteromonas macleodii]|uniref:Fe-S protein n=1 Tax=Alteromonas macleodii TaxID=28108 RepID=A0AB36FL72_ALTMA|nr:hypothetical protein BFV93_4840 [Alteromonas macleodii]OES24871.1 hypothetical protein BFV95_4630 [Alteromonas macleodii]OES25149.1 hypothetical protein BFV94_4620 [Alteromonas macleodii]OES39190.1 hypothetical protein BFV96_4338 [Alteromonas macleodii]
MFDFIDEKNAMQTQPAHTHTANNDYISGCRICNTLNDGICMSACIMDKTARQALIKKYAHLFHQAKLAKQS